MTYLLDNCRNILLNWVVTVCVLVFDVLLLYMYKQAPLCDHMDMRNFRDFEGMKYLRPQTAVCTKTGIAYGGVFVIGKTRTS